MNDDLVMLDDERTGRAASPSAGVLDSQSVKTTELAEQAERLRRTEVEATSRGPSSTPVSPGAGTSTPTRPRRRRASLPRATPRFISKIFTAGLGYTIWEAD